MELRVLDIKPPDSFLGIFNRLCSSPDIDRDGDLELNSEQVVDRLLPDLADELVEREIWPLLSGSPITLLHLRGVNRRWRSLIDTSFEWETLKIVLSTTDSWGTSEASDARVTQQLGIRIANYKSWCSFWGEEYRSNSASFQCTE